MKDANKWLATQEECQRTERYHSSQQNGVRTLAFWGGLLASVAGSAGPSGNALRAEAVCRGVLCCARPQTPRSCWTQASSDAECSEGRKRSGRSYFLRDEYRAFFRQMPVIELKRDVGVCIAITVAAIAKQLEVRHIGNVPYGRCQGGHFRIECPVFH